MSQQQIPFTFIDTPEALKKAANEWANENEFGIDLEMENNLHNYGCYTSIIQISSRSKNWIVDTLALKDISSVVKIFEDPSKLKIFHDVTFDFRLLEQEFKCKPRNIFDTEKAAVFLGKESVGLGSLLKEYFDVEKESKFQMADWTKRPINKEMLSYATKDTIYLLKLKDALESELKKKDRLDWIYEYFQRLEKADYPIKQMEYFEFRGYRSLSPRQQAILKELFLLREELAKKVDRPVHFIMNNKLLGDLLTHHPKKISDWENMKGVHPVVKRSAMKFHKAIQKGKSAKTEILPKTTKPKRFSEQQKKLIIRLGEKRDALAKKYEVPAHIFLSKDEMKEIAALNSLDMLMSWQKKLMEGFLK